MPQIGFDYLRQFEVTDSTLVLRRYMSHWKFSQTVESRTLYFAAAAKSSFSDELEGYHTKLDDDLSDAQLVRWGLDSRARAVASDSRAIVAAHNQKAVVISCWTAGINESLRMWSGYGQGPEAVAIETTVGELRRALGSDFLIVSVRYLDFSKQSIPKEHSLQPFFFKRRCYDWEQEVRVVGEMEVGERIGSPRIVPVDLHSLVRRVVVSPFASIDYRATVMSLLKAASLSLPVHDSMLRSDGDSSTSK
jgi:hypothetical protein